MTTFFTSDLHLYHSNIIRYCNRPFANVDEMNQAILDNYNAKVSDEDTVYFIGDIAFLKSSEAKADLPRYMGNLRGKKHLICGNHDRVASINRYFDSCRTYSEIEVSCTVLGEHAVGKGEVSERFKASDSETSGRRPKEDSKGSTKQLIILCHYPFLTWNKSHYGSWNLHGHCHGTLPDDPSSLRLDVGVDVHAFSPISFDEVSTIMSTKNFKPIDHHGKNK